MVIWQDMQEGGHGLKDVGFRDEWRNHKNLSQSSRHSSWKTSRPLQCATALNRQHIVTPSVLKLRTSSLTDSLWTMGVTRLLTNNWILSDNGANNLSYFCNFLRKHWQCTLIYKFRKNILRIKLNPERLFSQICTATFLDRPSACTQYSLSTSWSSSAPPE